MDNEQVWEAMGQLETLVERLERAALEISNAAQTNSDAADVMNIASRNMREAAGTMIMAKP